MISVDTLGVSFGGSFLFRNVSFVINSRDKIGLTGRNGAGKTTLLKIFMNLQKPDEGGVAVPRDIRLGYLPQQMIIKDERTLFEEAGTAFDEILVLESEIDHINHEIAERTDYDDPSYLDLIEQLAEKTERFHLLEGGSRDQKIEQVIRGLGFDRNDFGRPTREFSGGWRMRIELAKILLKAPDAILLDEPTNHLDIDSIQWLEEFLSEYHGAVVMISHDRAFLDHVTNRTLEISVGRVHDYQVPYSRYVTLRKERHDQQMAAFRNQQKKVSDTKEFIERFRYKATKAVQVQSRIKMLERMDLIEIDEEDVSRINMRFPPAPRSGEVVLEARGMSFSYGLKKVLNDISMVIRRGERIAFVGRNGEGKTTLSRIIAGELVSSGNLKTGYNVSIGYFAQNQDELLDGRKTVLETLDEVAVGDIRTKIRDLLGAFLFSGEDVDKKVRVLSGGERSRLALARLLLKPCSLLILDEPTNHLDMRSKDILKQALLKYDGTLIIVSHDREFLEGLVEKIYEFTEGQVREHLGGIYDFLQKRRMYSLAELERKQNHVQEQTGVEDRTTKQSYHDKKEFDREVRRIENQIKKMEDRIEELEQEVRGLEAALEDPSAATEGSVDPGHYTRYQDLQNEISRKIAGWESLLKELEHVKNKRN